MNSFPFDSQVTYDEDGVPSYDRAYNSAGLRDYLKLFLTDGVFPNPSTNLQVTTSEQNMAVTVLPGSINIQGALGIEDEERTLVLQAANKDYNRIDSVVARLDTDFSYRSIDLYVLQGTASASPKAPELTRTKNKYELRLANVFVAKNATTVSGSRITDTRLNTDDCGIVTGIIQKVDTTTIYKQYNDYLKDISTETASRLNGMEKGYASYIESSEEEFEAWFKTARDTLSEDTAGNLQNEIGTASSIEVGDGSLTSAILEIFERLGIGMMAAEDGEVLTTESGISLIV
jgi:hypothetical protein